MASDTYLLDCVKSRRLTVSQYSKHTEQSHISRLVHKYATVTTQTVQLLMSAWHACCCWHTQLQTLQEGLKAHLQQNGLLWTGVFNNIGQRSLMPNEELQAGQPVGSRQVM